jgi:3-oxoacyl-[acyl-carrier protein] reductase
MALAAEGVHVTLTARGAEALAKTAAEIRKLHPGVTVTEVAGDITTPGGREAALKACPDPDILVNNAGGPPHGDFRDWSEEDWQKAVNGNMITPIMLIKATIDGMCARKFGRIVNITSGSVKSPIPNLGMSNGARAGLTGFCAGLARQVAKHNVTINGLLPGAFLTDRLRSGIEFEARRQNISFEEMLAKRSATNPAGRVGDPKEFGDACAFLCAASSGFIVGQNLLLDGGAFNSTMG